MLGARNRTSKTHPHGPHRYYPSVCTWRTNLSKPFWLRLKITLGNPKTCRGLRGHRGASARAADTSRSPRPPGGARTPRCGNRKPRMGPRSRTTSQQGGSAAGHAPAFAPAFPPAGPHLSRASKAQWTRAQVPGTVGPVQSPRTDPLQLGSRSRPLDLGKA